MLTNSFSIPISAGTPCFAHSCKLENIFENILVEVIPEFINGLTQYPRTKRMNEKDFTQEFVDEISRALATNNRGVVVSHEHSDIYTEGAHPNKCVDFAFIAKEKGASKQSLYTVEAKRLPTGEGQREREYVCGSFPSGSPAGGIQRFKTGDHGYGLPHSGLLGYIEENEFTHWHSLINGWIVEESSKPQGWKEEEQLQEMTIDSAQTYSIARSVAHRASDTIDLFHLWIKIPIDEINYYPSAKTKANKK